MRKGQIAEEILRVLSHRPIFLSSPKASAASQILLSKLEAKGIGRRRRNNVKIAIDRLRRQRCIEYSHESDKHLLRLTDSGERRLLRYQIFHLKLAVSRWDKIWRIILFDIPEEKKMARDSITRKLKNMGFYQFQRSVFVHYLDCQQEVNLITDYFNVREYFTLIEAFELGNQEYKAKSFFELS